MPLLGFSLKVFWMQSSYERGLIVWTTTVDKFCILEPPSKFNRKRSLLCIHGKEISPLGSTGADLGSSSGAGVSAGAGAIQELGNF